jgi:hypothetical protein
MEESIHQRRLSDRMATLQWTFTRPTTPRHVIFIVGEACGRDHHALYIAPCDEIRRILEGFIVSML